MTTNSEPCAFCHVDHHAPGAPKCKLAISPHCDAGNHRWSDITTGGNQVCLRYGCVAERTKR